MFKLDVSLQLHAMRPVLQTVTIGHATFVRDIYEARRCDKPINEWINNEIAFLKKKKKQKRPSNRNVIHVSDELKTAEIARNYDGYTRHE